MKRTNVTSSNVKSVGYDEKNELLEIEFNSGGIYLYSGVPKQVYHDLMNASSHGKFVHQQIRGKYPYTRII